MDTNKDMKTREKDLLAKEAELNRREKVTGSETEAGFHLCMYFLALRGLSFFLFSLRPCLKVFSRYKRLPCFH
jgi:hypothetical protein